MSAKHTPGQWIFGYGVTSEYGEVFGVGVATKPDWTVVCAISRPVDVNSTDQANARLIAAAPDLLKALQGMVDYYGTASSNVEALEAARAAIAKAIG